ncbi:polarity establishment/cellular polarization [Taxawa tesnikishii (nom. ined.)]|nr:polarity establishment/cellular polarization [Dothideales sp. JES 119]
MDPIQQQDLNIDRPSACVERPSTIVLFALIASEVAGFTGAAATFTLFISVNQFAFAPQEEVLNVTIGIPIDYTALQSQLLLNGVQAARDQIRSVAAQLPSWLSVDNETFALSGTPPSGFQSQDANITVTDVAGDVAIKTLQLRAANFSLFNGEVGSMTATAGQPFSYTFNQSMFTRQDLTLSCQLADANPTRVDANVTARSSTLATSESQKFSIQIKAAKAGIHSSTTSYSSASASVPPASRPTPSPPTGATSRSSHDRSRAGVIAGAVVGGLRSRSPRKLEISRPILQEGEQIEALQGFSDLEKAESAPDRLPAEPPQIALDLPSPTRQPSASKYRISLASSIGDGEAAIRADSNIPVWGRRSAAQHTPHDSYSAATEIARLSRLSPTKRLSQNLLGKRNPRQSLGLGIDTGMQDQPSQRSRRTEVLSDGRSRSSFGSLLTRNTSVLSAKPSDFPQPPRSSWRLSRAMIPGLSITDAADKRKSIRLVDRTDSVPDTRPLAEKRQSFIRNRASSGVQSPLFATGSRASSHALHGPSGSVGGSSVEASSVRHHPSLRRETRGISRAATTHSASSSLEPPARNPRRLDRSHVGSRDFEVIQETNSPTHSANSRDQNSNFTTTSSDTDSASLSASDVEADIQAQLALPRHQRTWVLPGEASPTPPPLTPRSHSRPSTAGSSNPSRNESVAREALRRKWAQRLHRDSHGNLAHDVLASSSSPPANAAVIMPARGAIGDYLSRSGSSRDVGKENQSSLTASKGKRSSGIREPMSLVSNDSLRGARTERPRLVLRNSKMRTGSETVGPKEEVQRLSSLKAMDADAGAGNDEWEDVVEEDASETEKERKEAKEMTPMSTLSGKAFV